MSTAQSSSTSPVRGSNDELPPPAWQNHTASFHAAWDTARVVITARGELDASNAIELADYFDLCIAHSTPLVLDLSGLDFFGTAGFSALHLINVRCAGANLRWAVVPNRAVSRLLGICDPDSALPMIDSAHASLDDGGTDRSFQLVT